MKLKPAVSAIIILVTTTVLGFFLIPDLSVESEDKKRLCNPSQYDKACHCNWCAKFNAD